MFDRIHLWSHLLLDLFQVFPRTDTASGLVPAMSHSRPLPPQETLWYEQVSLIQSLLRWQLFSPGSRCAHDLVCTPPRGEFLVPPDLWNSCDQIPLAFKARFSGGFSTGYQILRLWGAWCGAQNFHSYWRISVVKVFSSLWAAHLACMVFDFITVVPLVLSGGFFGCGVSFVVGSSVLFLMVLLLMVVQQLVVILVFP